MTLLGDTVVFAGVCLFHAVTAFLFDDGIRHVDTRLGQIVGHVEIIRFDGGNVPIARYLGIPYAKPPVGDLRLRKPVPVSKLSSPYTAHEYKPSCIQLGGQQLGKVFSEDCLYLNIFSQVSAGRPGANLKPVMVWIHGGGFISGDSNLYEGDTLVAYTDIVLVTFNYRLGPLGFFSLHDDYSRGNYGLWDQHLAIQWVKDNIRDFGGDPDTVTIFGESAGSASVLYQMVYAGNKGLFRRAIAESGAIRAFATTPRDQSYNNSLAFATALGCNNTSHAEVMICVSVMSESAVKAANQAMLHVTLDYPHPAWVPVYDGYFVIADPANLLQEASGSNSSSRYPAFVDVDLLTGVNNYDGGVYMPLLFNSPSIYQTLTEKEFDTVDIPALFEFVYKRPPSAAEVKAVIREYKSGTNRTSLVESLLQAITDVVYTVPTVETSRAHAAVNRSRTYLYLFSATPPKRVFPLPPYLADSPSAASHADELLYVFGFPPSLWQGLLNLSSPISASDMKLSKFIMTLWTNFARSGDPNSPKSARQFYDIGWQPFSVAAPHYLYVTPALPQGAEKSDLAHRAVTFWESIQTR